MSPRPAPVRPARPRGFALLVTIVLVAFLVLVLVGLATFTRVETQVAANSQAEAKARQNALLAVNIALGQLQKFTGPDQRITARADITTADDKLTRVNDEPVVNDIKNPLWTGVWDSSKWKPLTGEYDGTVRGRTKPEVMTWLVSGNEDAAAPRRFTPLAALPPSTAAAPKQVLMNGVTAAGAPDPANPRVEVPLVKVESDSVPGFTGTQTVGHFAWWVGDEGVKARINQVAPAQVADLSPPSTPTSTDAEQYYWKAMSPTRAGGELAGPGAGNRLFPDFAKVFATTSDGEALRANLRSVVSDSQLPLLSASSGGPLVPQPAFLRNSTSFTTFSSGVIADTVRGGLRLDLTRYLETGQTDGAFSASDSLYADAALPGGRQPAFSLLKSWYDIGTGLSTPGFGAAADIRAETTNGNVITGHGLYPVITRYQVAYAAASAGPGSSFDLLFHPSVVLWNPHNVTLRATNLIVELELDFAMRCFAFAGVSGSSTEARAGTTVHYLKSNSQGAVGPVPAYQYGLVRLSEIGLSPPGRPAILGLRIPGVELAPGESLVFSPLGGPGGSQQTAAPQGATAASFPEMSPLWNDRAFLRAATGLTLEAGPPVPAGQFMWCRIGADTVQPYRFKARLYRQDDHPQRPLQNLELGFVEPPTNAHDPGAPVNDPGFVLSSAAPLVNTSYRTVGMVMRTPFDSNASVAAGTASFAPAVPYSIFNIRGAYGVNTSFERWDQSFAGDPFFRAFKLTSLPTPPLDPDISADRDRGYVGLSDRAQSGPGRVTQGNYGVFFDYPRRATAAQGNASRPVLMSLAEFQQVDLGSSAMHPTYVFGNSWPDPRIGREEISGRWSGFPAPDPLRQGLFQPNDFLLRDASYLANHAVWDRFFLSTLPQSSPDAPLEPSTHLPNSRHRVLPGMIAGKPGYPSLSDLRDTRAAAGSLLLDGAFNINSTSVDAWRALLGGLADLTMPDEGWSQGGSPSGSTNNPANRGLRHAYSRFLLPRSAAFDQTQFDAGTTNGTLSRAAWTGHRYLTDTEIDTLARNLVEEVKVRGPFMSLADFVNRRLIRSADDGPSPTNNINEHRLKVGALGAIQKAILNLPDVSKGLNAALNQPAVTSATGFSYSAGGSFTPRVPLETIGTSMGFRALKDFPSQLELLTGGLLGQLAYGAPGFLTQADVLQKIGPVLAARSDTFVVRTYGDSLNPATGEVESRAWCEVVVQRLPEYLDNSQPPQTALADLNPTNREFGRRYQVVSFRWLRAADL